jgi:hypothetical protein
MIFINENLDQFHNLLPLLPSVKRKRSEKIEEEEKVKKEFEREQMLEQVHQLELQKNYESDEKLDESTD